MKVYDGDAAGTDSAGRDDPPERVKVGIAEYEVAAGGTALTTSGLGSCIGLALYDRTAGVIGLVHVMLPTADGGDGAPAKFADSGTERLIEAMAEAGADPDRLAAKLAGGSDMLEFSGEEESIGTRNAETVRATLDEHGIPVVAEDVGGDYGRSLRLDPDGDLAVKSANGADTRV
jgi:chemotaxis protein CheD